jgi:hypothetical protein
MARLTAALAVGAAALAGAAPAAPAFVFVGPGWRVPVEAADVFAFQSFAPAPGRIGLSVTLRPDAAGRLEALTAASVSNRLTVEDGDGAVLLEAWIAEPIRGRFAVAFDDPDAARRAARRLQGAE